MKHKYLHLIIPKNYNTEDESAFDPLYDLLVYLNEDLMSFSTYYGKYTEWIIEFSDSGLPVREIGLIKGEVMHKAPQNEVNGFWKHTKLVQNDLETLFGGFNITVLSESVFQDCWKTEIVIYDFQVEIEKFQLVWHYDEDDDGYTHLETIIFFKDRIRELIIYFSNDECYDFIEKSNLLGLSKFKIRGKLVNQGIDSPLFLVESELVD